MLTNLKAALLVLVALACGCERREAVTAPAPTAPAPATASPEARTASRAETASSGAGGAVSSGGVSRPPETSDRAPSAERREEAASARRSDRPRSAQPDGGAGSAGRAGGAASPSSSADGPAATPGAPPPSASRNGGSHRRAARADRDYGESEPGSSSKARVVTVFFGTDRNTTDDRRTEYALGEQRSNVKYGRAYVSIPLTHKMGKIERPSWLRFEFSENPDRHVVVRRISLYDREPFLTSLSDEIRRSAGRSSFLFVHGYNVSFADAARRTAQMTYDLGFDGVPIFYSWPSRASTASYTIDEQNIEWSESNIAAFLEDVLSVAEAENVYLIAHSMGNRGLTRALRTLMDRQPSLVRKVKEVILAAPDIDADVFRRDLAPALAKLGAGITLYASSSDRALMASRAVHGEQRAGESRPSIMRVRGIESVDASGIDTSFLGHSAYAEVRAVMADIYNIIRHRQRAEQRFGLVKVDEPPDPYWRFRH